jgi:hypothetical protein
VAGSSDKGVDFGDGPITTTNNDANGFVAKLRGSDGSGKTADGYWGRMFGDALHDQQATAVAVDASGNIALAGTNRGTVNFGGGDLVSSGGLDIFLARLAPNGAAAWSRGLGDAQDQWPIGVTTDDTGSIVVTAGFSGTINFGGSTASADPGMWNGLIFKYSAMNILQWAKTLSPNSSLLPRGGVSNSVVVVGAFTGSIDLGAGPLTAAKSSMLLGRLDAAGNVLWNRHYGDVGNVALPALALTGAGEPIVAGTWSGAVDFGAGALQAGALGDAFVAKFGL